MSKLSFLKMVSNFTQELAEFVAAGAPVIKPEDYQKRLEACNACEHLKRNRCSLCGCVVEYKAKWATTDCPDTPSRWKKKRNVRKKNPPKTSNEVQSPD